MAHIITRILMWVFIVAAVWLFARQQSQRPSTQQHDAMRDAARHYQTEKSRMQRHEDDPVPPVSADNRPGDTR